MDAYRVDRQRVAVSLKLRDGLELAGHVFLPPEPRDEPLVNKVQLLLNGSERFLPVETEGGRTVVHNKESILWCRYDGPPGPVVEVLSPRRRVTLILADGTELAGDLVAFGPPDRRRVLDCLNLARTFLLIESPKGDHLVRTDAIQLVPSAEGGDPRAESGEIDLFELEAHEPALQA